MRDISERIRLIESWRGAQKAPLTGYKFQPGRYRTTTTGMDGLLRFLAALACDVLRGRRALICENALLRQQLIVAERSSTGAASGGDCGSASRWPLPRAWLRRGSLRYCWSSQLRSFDGTALDFVRSCGAGRNRCGDRQRPEPR